jgi:hypothetical protein
MQHRERASNGRRSFLLVVVGVSLLAPTTPASAAMFVAGYNPANHDRFYVGADKAFIGDADDWSGVALNGSAAWATMISPNYFLSANHAHPANGSTLTFYYSNDPSGAYETATVASGQYVGNADVWLGKLSAPVTSHVTKYPILLLPNLPDYVGLTIDTFGLSNGPIASQNQRLGRNVIDYYGDFVFGYNYNIPGLGADESVGIAGDSGAPAFVIANGVPAFTGTVWMGNQSSYTQDCFVSRYVSQINAAMVGEQVTTISSIPEPSALALLVGLAVASLVRQTRSGGSLRRLRLSPTVARR